MIKKFTFPLLLSLIILSLAGCITSGTPAVGTSAPSSLPPTQGASHTSTPLPPTMPPTVVPPNATATPLPVNLIQHFPTGQEFTVTTIHMLDATTGWSIGGLGSIVGDHVLFTTDGGSTWKDVTPLEEEALSGAHKAATGFFQDARTAWVTYAIDGGTPVPSLPVVWHTTDGGASWSASQPLDVNGLADIYVPAELQFVAGQTGWLRVHVGAGMIHDYTTIYRSTDGGATWTRIIDPYTDGGIQSCTKNDMLFTDATHGWLTGDCGGVQASALLFKSTDASSTWQLVTLPEPADYPGIFSNESQIACGSYNPFFFSNDFGRLAVNCQDYSGTQMSYFYYIFTTQDGGSTWTSSSYPGEALYFFSADTGWALAAKIKQTIDGGATWKTISDVSWTAQVDFVSAQLGWGVARSDTAEALVKTDNGGATWTELTPSVGP